jgi:hypothetical protein
MLIMLMPAGLETYFAELAAFGADGPPDKEKVLEASDRYGIVMEGLGAD